MSKPTAPPRPGTVHIAGAGPVGLFLAALLQSDGWRVRLYERRREYTRSRMVSLADYLTADSIDTYRTDPLDGQNVHAIFDRDQLEAGLAYRSTMAADLRGLLEDWTRGFVPLNTIERALSELIASRATGTVERVDQELDPGSALAMLDPGDLLVDCTGARSLMRDLLVPGPDPAERDRNTTRIRMEYALVITFLYDQDYQCNELCKYYKNIGNAAYKFIPAVRRTHYDGSTSHVTGIVNIREQEFDALPPTCTGGFLRERFPDIALSMDQFIDRIKAETHGQIIGDLQVVRLPLDLYRARHVTSQAWQCSGADHPLAASPVFLLGDSALGSPYFQSISLGLEASFVLARHLGNPALTLQEVFTRWEAFMYRQWIRVYMRTQMLKHDKDLLESVGDNSSLLGKMHVF
ncbi:FAD-dependent monooxygenase [Ornithinimicrobium sp. F0845]|uniref:FAD-dependent oxidoreductase n=1 Tax=Ornithinimicrobium sp. F0845 TaxID=2926412 RepID=UPI001FF1DD29|nr:FAD-dependent monooxygenase [Ornithinimicrobium sp. F0845]MCK0113612.1 FAD-dependent monooxygenase [Ornithinimicrobium sp. F0845]